MWLFKIPAETTLINAFSEIFRILFYLSEFNSVGFSVCRLTALQASVTVRKFGVITKYTEICIAGNPLNYFFESNLEGDTHQFTTAPLHNEAMATIIADEPW